MLLDIRSGVGGALLLWPWPPRSLDTLLLFRWFVLLTLLPLGPSPAPPLLLGAESFR